MKHFLLRLSLACVLLLPGITGKFLFAHIPDSLLVPAVRQAGPLLRMFPFRSDPKSVDTLIVNLLAQVSPDSIGATIRHLQDYGTRECTKPEAFLAQDWITARLSSFGLPVTIQDFPYPSGSSDNVIAVLTGTVHPDEYIAVGAHYDSYSGGPVAPGADDNASGTAAVIEIARILSQHSFDRSIIFGLWSAEEYGLYGSQAYASSAAAGGMDILGYINIDMCGYQYGNTVKTNVTGPTSAQPLMQFYEEICGMYLPDFEVTLGGNLPGSSDHASFNACGYMGIFPFEDVNHYSPYIHSPNDTLGLSVNSLPMCAVFARGVMAATLEMANQVPPPVSLLAMPGYQQIGLSWENPGVQAAEYRIYRDDMNQVYAVTTDTFFTDQNVVSGSTYLYAVSLVSQGGKESLQSDKVLAKAVGPLPMPFSDNFENGFTWWMTSEGWALTTSASHSPNTSLTDSPGGNYANEADKSVFLIPFSLELAESASLECWVKFDLEDGYDFATIEISTGGAYEELLSFTGTQLPWTFNSIDLQDYCGSPYVSLRFRISTDVFVNHDGIYFDDIVVNTVNTGTQAMPPVKPVIRVMPNPFHEQAVIRLDQASTGQVRLEVMDALGRTAKVLHDGLLHGGEHDFLFSPGTATAGMYFFRLVADGKVTTGKITAE